MDSLPDTTETLPATLIGWPFFRVDKAEQGCSVSYITGKVIVFAEKEWQHVWGKFKWKMNYFCGKKKREWGGGREKNDNLFCALRGVSTTLKI